VSAPADTDGAAVAKGLAAVELAVEPQERAQQTEALKGAKAQVHALLFGRTPAILEGIRVDFSHAHLDSLP
jgi:hypothetical protein